MTAAAAVLLAAATAIALADWWAVWRAARPVEYVAKPATLILLVAVALALEPADEAVRWWFVAGLVASLAGDVLLMLPRGPFAGGLAAFLVAHLCYVAGFAVAGPRLAWAVAGGIVAAAGCATAGPGLIRGVRRRSPRLAGPVVAYLGALSAMVVLAFGAGHALAAAGGTLFLVSDAILGWTRFVQPFRNDRVVVHATYHLAQAMLVGWLAA